MKGNLLFQIHNADQFFEAKPVKQTQNINYQFLTEELQKAQPHLKTFWKMQDNQNDRLTDKIVYKARSFDELVEMYNENPNGDFDYLVHRWYNFQTSQMTEKIFCSYNVARKEEKTNHKTIDFYIMDTPFDLKVSSFPKRFGKKREDFNSDREFRNELIRWLYENQSKGRRNHHENRLFVICKHNEGLNSRDNLLLKKDFKQIHKKVDTYLKYSMEKMKREGVPFNKVTLNDGETVFADVLFVS